MTALEAYALAKKIAKSAVSGIKSLTVNGTTLTIETNDGNTIDMVFPTPADGRGIASAEIDSNGHLILTYDDGITEDAGEIPGANVEVTQLLSSGIKIAKIKVNGTVTELFAPAGGGAADLSGVIADKFDDTKNYVYGDKVLYEGDNLLYKFIKTHDAGPWDPADVKVITVVDLLNEKFKPITQAEYDALSEEEKHDLGVEYFIWDAPGGGGGGGGTSDYLDLDNKPKINGITLAGDKTFDDLGLSSLTTAQLNGLLDII